MLTGLKSGFGGDESSMIKILSFSYGSEYVFIFLVSKFRKMRCSGFFKLVIIGT